MGDVIGMLRIDVADTGQNSGGFNGSSNQADEFSSVVGKHAFRRLSFSEFLLRGSFTTSTPVTYRSSSLKQQRRRSSWMEAAYHAVSDFSNQNHSNNIAHNIHVTIPALSLGGAADAERERTVDFETSSSHLTRLEEGTLAGNFFPSKLLQHHPSSGWRTGFDSPTIEADDGTSAIEQLKNELQSQGGFDIIFMDSVM
eukprot:gene24219-25953_t